MRLSTTLTLAAMGAAETSAIVISAAMASAHEVRLGNV